MKNLVYFVKKYSLNIFIMTLTSILISLSSVFIINAIKDGINESINGTLDSFKTILFKLLVGLVVGSISTYLLKYNTGYFSANVVRDLKENSINHILKLPIDFVEKSNYGDLINRLSSDIENIAIYLSTLMKDVFYTPIFLLVNIIYLLSIDIKLAIFCLLPIAIGLPITTIIINHVKKSQKEYVERLGNTYNNIQEVSDGINTIKAYRLEQKMYDKYYNDVRGTVDISKKNDMKQYATSPFYILMGNFPTIIALFYGGYQTFNGNLNIGILIAFVTALGTIIGPVTWFSDVIAKTKLAYISVSRVFDILNIEQEDDENKITTICTDKENVFELKNITYSYGTTDDSQVILNNINLTIKKGEKVALVGKSGCGKSTLLKLLYNHYNINSGEIKFFDEDYKNLAKRTLRENISLISQDSFLFPMSVFDNIKVGNKEATYEEVIEASKLANCHNFIMEMPNGYDTFVGEKASKLSGGQRQRLSIARAILENNEVLLLDEPTSALDRDSEILVNNALLAISKNKTVITIAHRLNTIIDSDKIVVIADKEIKETGTHEELINKNGLYKSIYNEYEGSAVL